MMLIKSGLLDLMEKDQMLLLILLKVVNLCMKLKNIWFLDFNTLLNKVYFVKKT